MTAKKTMYLIIIYDLDEKPMMLKIGVTTYSLEHRLNGYLLPLKKVIVFTRQFNCEVKMRSFERGIRIWGKESKESISGEWFYYSKKIESKIIEMMKNKKPYERRTK